MTKKYLDHKLDCKTCGTIYLNIPEGAKEDTSIHCSTCNAYMGTWGEMQDDFDQQAEHGVFDLKDGQIKEK